MSNKNYLAFDSIRFGLRAVIDHSLLLLKFSLVFAVFCGILLMLRWIGRGVIGIEDLKFVVESMDPFLIRSRQVTLLPGAYFSLSRLLFRGLLNLFAVKVALMAYDNQEPSFKEMFSCYGLLPRFFLASLLRSLGVIAGFLLFIIPGILLFLRLTFFEYFMLDKNSRPIEALKCSYNVTKNRMLDIFIFWVLSEILAIIILFIVMFLFILVSSITDVEFIVLGAQGASIVINIFVINCGCAFFYRKLTEQSSIRIEQA